jgi:hypothetical protein
MDNRLVFVFLLLAMSCVMVNAAFRMKITREAEDFITGEEIRSKAVSDAFNPVMSIYERFLSAKRMLAMHVSRSTVSPLFYANCNYYIY